MLSPEGDGLFDLTSFRFCLTCIVVMQSFKFTLHMVKGIWFDEGEWLILQPCTETYLLNKEQGKLQF